MKIRFYNSNNNHHNYKLNSKNIMKCLFTIK